jgi:CO dehydrogenase/acetyl-CoA synthase beta subunit
MGLFDKQHAEIISFIGKKRKQGIVADTCHTNGSDWPSGKTGNLVLARDAAIELGNPRDISASFLIWRNGLSDIEHGRVTIVGPDLPQLTGKQVSFGKIVIVGGEDFDENNSYQRYREMERVRYDIHLEGYMMRGVSQYQREWSRVSREAIDAGFSFQVLGNALIDQMSQLEYVRSVEVIFITSGPGDVVEIKPIAESVMTIIAAMNKMATELSFDCDTCEYAEVCDDVAELRSMRHTLKQREAKVHA